MNEQRKAHKEKVLQFLVESNAIEGVYDEESARQAKRAWDYLIKEGELTSSNIRRTHKILMLHLMGPQKGYWRFVDVRVGDYFAPPAERVDQLMEEWIFKANETIKMEPERVSHFAKLDHIAFEQIHPFVDGNGRIGRILFNWQRQKAGLDILVIKEVEKNDYYKWFSQS